MAGSPSPTHPPTTPWHRRTLLDVLEAREPGFDLLRLVLAGLVLVSHTWPLGGFGIEPSSPLAPRYLTLGGLAVGGFFALSGLFVGRSALQRRSGAFARARAARILPAYWLALLLGAVVVGPLAWWHERGGLGGYVTIGDSGPVAYAASNTLLPTEIAYRIHDVFVTSTPYGRATGQSFVNGSLWTLPYEVRCYLVIGLLALIAARWGSRRTITIAWAMSLLAAIGYDRRAGLATAVLGPYADRLMVMFAFVFLTGALAAVYADRLRVFGLPLLVGLAVAIVAGRTNLFLAEHVGHAALLFVLVPIAVLLSPIGRQLRGHDISYGLYLYAWPVQQLVAMYGWTSNAFAFIVVSMLITAAVATASWLLVERPVMARFGRRRATN